MRRGAGLHRFGNQDRLTGTGKAGQEGVVSTGLTGETTVTQRLIDAAGRFGDRPALIGACGGSAGRDSRCGAGGYSFTELASTIRRAAAGLAWRGLRPRDVVGVYVPDAITYVLACHAVSAAGAIPSPVRAGLSVTEIAGQLADCGARMLMTAEPLAATGLAAADRSWVRQVISFGDAPAATPFCSLLSAGSLAPPPARSQDVVLLSYQRRPADLGLIAAASTNADREAELAELAASAPVGDADVVVAAEPAGDGRSYAAYLDHALLHGATVVAAGVADVAATARRLRGTAAVVPSGVTVPGDQLRMLVVS